MTFEFTMKPHPEGLKPLEIAYEPRLHKLKIKEGITRNENDQTYHGLFQGDLCYFNGEEVSPAEIIYHRFPFGGFVLKGDIEFPQGKENICIFIRHDHENKEFGYFQFISEFDQTETSNES